MMGGAQSTIGMPITEQKQPPPAVLANCAAALSLLLSACATNTPEPRIETRDVPIPVAVQCRPKLSPKPAFPDSDAAIAQTSDVFDLAKLYRAGRALREAWIAELEAALKGCAG